MWQFRAICVGSVYAYRVKYERLITAYELTRSVQTMRQFYSASPQSTQIGVESPESKRGVVWSPIS